MGVASLGVGSVPVGEPEKGSFHVPRHRQLDGTTNVIPFESEADVARPRPILGDIVLEF
jgi:ssRNA-specific RNase YbeY (16S rRNA maturation enzyme)